MGHFTQTSNTLRNDESENKSNTSSDLLRSHNEVTLKVRVETPKILARRSCDERIQVQSSIRSFLVFPNQILALPAAVVYIEASRLE